MSAWDVAIRPDLYSPPEEDTTPIQRKQQHEPEEVSPPQPRGSGTALPDNVRVQMEGAFGADFSAVRIHEGSQAASVGALAYTQGTDIHFQPGQYNPYSQRGRELLGHELTHVVQQSQGRVQSTTQAKGVAVNDDPALEREADEMGAKAAFGQPAISESSEMQPSSNECACGGTCSRCSTKSTSSSSAPSSLKISSGIVQRKCNPGGDAQISAVDDSPLGLPFLGQANTAEELSELMNELAANVGVNSLHLFAEAEVRLATNPFNESGKAVSAQPVQRMQNTDKPIQRATVAGCHVPGVAANAIGIAAHGQIEATCVAGYPGCQAEVPIPGAGRADLLRNWPPMITEIGEIKPASWLGLGLQRVAQAQLAQYIEGYNIAYGREMPVPMHSVTVPTQPFILNPAQQMTTWGPSNGIYYYSCRGGRRRPVRRPIRVPVPRQVPVPSTQPQTGPNGRDIATGVAVTGAGIGIGYVIYRGVRMIPSIFFPPSIPANLAIP